MRKILCLAVIASLAGSTAAIADTPAQAIEKLGLYGTWATYCTPGLLGQPGLRIVFTPPGDAPIFTTVSAEGPITTTVRSTVLDATPAGKDQLKLKLRIIGGDRDGGPLPATMTNTFEQLVEKVEGQGIRLVGGDPRVIQKCPE